MAHGVEREPPQHGEQRSGRDRKAAVQIRPAPGPRARYPERLALADLRRQPARLRVQQQHIGLPSGPDRCDGGVAGPLELPAGSAGLLFGLSRAQPAAPACSSATTAACSACRAAPTAAGSASFAGCPSPSSRPPFPRDGSPAAGGPVPLLLVTAVGPRRRPGIRLQPGPPLESDVHPPQQNSALWFHSPPRRSRAPVPRRRCGSTSGLHRVRRQAGQRRSNAGTAQVRQGCTALVYRLDARRLTAAVTHHKTARHRQMPLHSDS